MIRSQTRRFVPAALALVALGGLVPAALPASAPEGSLLDRVRADIKEARQQIRQQEKDLHGMAVERDRGEAEDPEGTYARLQELRGELALARSFMDAKQAVRDSLKRIRRRSNALALEGEEKDRLLARVDDLFLAYYDGRLAHVRARWQLAESLGEAERKEAEQLLTLREKQKIEAEAELRALLEGSALLDPGEPLP